MTVVDTRTAGGAGWKKALQLTDGPKKIITVCLPEKLIDLLASKQLYGESRSHLLTRIVCDYMQVTDSQRTELEDLL